jgi:hypothetical protein
VNREEMGDWVVAKPARELAARGGTLPPKKAGAKGPISKKKKKCSVMSHVKRDSETVKGEAKK